MTHESLPPAVHGVRRSSDTSSLPPELSTSFLLDSTKKSYKHQYSNIYFIRLSHLRKAVDEAARKKWDKQYSNPKHVPRVLDVVKGQLCYIIGTVYLDMPLKPNVLEDIGKEHWLTPPPPPSKYHSASDTVMLEDESGRVKLSFPGEQGFQLVTGIIMAALGAENQSGDFEVVDICFSGMAPQAPLGEAPISQDTQMDVDEEPVAGPSKGKSSQPGSWIALVSGLDISSHPTPTFDKQEISLQLLNEYIQAELGGIDDQEESAQLSRVVVAGGILGPIARAEDPQGESKKASSAPAVPTSHPTPLQQATAFLKELCHSIPVHILPGASDPAGTTLPQQPLLKGLFGLGKGAGDEEALISESNPTWISIDGCQLLGHSGQPLDDVYKYVSSQDRLSMARDTLLWRHMAPTAPDTLWCYPFFNTDPFIITKSPHVYFIGNQPEFRTKLVEDSGKKTRIILLPKFSLTGEIVLVHSITLDVRRVVFR